MRNKFLLAVRFVRAVLSGYRVVVVSRSFFAVHRAVDRRDALDWFRQYDGTFGESVTMYRYGRFCARRITRAAA